MKRFYEKISDLMFKYSGFILQLVPILVIMLAVTGIVIGVVELKNNSYIQVKYEFVTQDGEVKEGYGCRTSNGEGICIGDDGTKYFDVKSYKVIPVQETQE